eukprot:2290631-Rhodomonas_salina.1
MWYCQSEYAKEFRKLLSDFFDAMTKEGGLGYQVRAPAKSNAINSVLVPNCTAIVLLLPLILAAAHVRCSPTVSWSQADAVEMFYDDTI